MGRPGNKRLQRALYGAAPSSATGSLTTEGTGRYAVTRVTGSVINNGGNMRSGGYPRVGMGLAFLRKTRCNPLCDSFVGRDEDLVVVTVADLATGYVTEHGYNKSEYSDTGTALTNAAAASANAAAGTDAVAVANAAAAEEIALATFNSVVGKCIALAQTVNDATAPSPANVSFDPIQTKAETYIDAVAATAIALGVYNASAKGASDLSTYNTVVASEATALTDWIVV